jgi:hypothetical protein
MNTLTCDNCHERQDSDVWYQDLEGFVNLFGYLCTNCQALADSGGLMYLDLESQESGLIA